MDPIWQMIYSYALRTVFPTYNVFYMEMVFWPEEMVVRTKVLEKETALNEIIGIVKPIDDIITSGEYPYEPNNSCEFCPVKQNGKCKKIT